HDGGGDERGVEGVSAPEADEDERGHEPEDDQGQSPERERLERSFDEGAQVSRAAECGGRGGGGLGDEEEPTGDEAESLSGEAGEGAPGVLVGAAGNGERRGELGGGEAVEQ